MEQKNGSEIHLQKRLLNIVRTIHTRGFQKISEYGIHPGQMELIGYISLHDGARPVEIGKALHVKPSTVSVSVKRLEKSGFLETRPDGKDQRSIRVYATERLKQMKGQIWNELLENEEIALRGFSQKECEELLGYLKRIQDNFESISKPLTICCGKPANRKEEE
ncbi:MAG: MarR family winged helix-turn-helix transcriptional regulator [Fusicatenibacter sp.]|nr:MarR family winged helix-turn-helix transcriptional regulator [Lachnospiraceae bacterium]MDY2938840.1 MarR family winged helix-turn-helix transcriptional regulator [Fusicatenibacter sp.]